MRKGLRKSFARPLINYLSTMVIKDMLPEENKGPRDYSKKVDSDEAFKYRRKEDPERKEAYNDPRIQKLPARIRRVIRDWGEDHIQDIIDHIDWPYLGLSPEWTESVFGPQEAQKQIREMKQDYLKVGIHKDPNEPLLPEETMRLNQYYKTVGKPEVVVPTENKYNAEQEYKDVEEEQPVYNSMRKAQVPDHEPIQNKINRLAKLVKTGGDPSTIRALQSEIKIYNIKNPVTPPSEAERNIRITPNQDKSALMTKSLINRINNLTKGR